MSFQNCSISITIRNKVYQIRWDALFLKFLIVLLVLVWNGACTKKQDSSVETSDYLGLRESFNDPGMNARPKVYWWWLNGHIDTLRMVEELRAIKAAGLSGVDIFDIGVKPSGNPNQMIPAGPGFMSEASVRAMEVVLKEAEKLGLEVGLSLSSSWNAGGSWVKPKHAAKTIYYSKTEIDGEKLGLIELPFPKITSDRNGKLRNIEYGRDGRPAYFKEVAVIAVPSNRLNLTDTTEIINVSQHFNTKSEILNWRPKTGKWNVFRFISSNSGEQLVVPSENSKGPIIDHFDSTATQMHLEYFLDRLKPITSKLNESPLKYLYLASYEAKEFAWTGSFPATFKKVNGYEVYKFLPSLFEPKVFDSLLLEKFNHDYAETFSELMIKNHYGKAKEICNQNDLEISSEAGGPGHMHHIPVESLKALGSLDVPRGEFWFRRPYLNKDSTDMVWLVKEIAAASHTYKKRIVEQEAFTSYKDWQEAPKDLKPYADRAFAEGMNKLVIHGFPHNPSEYGYPGIAYFAGTHFNDKRVWWPKVKPFNDYLARISQILQNSNFVADVLWYYGEEIPNLVPPKNTPFHIGKGYDYEVINTEILLNELTVENGKFVLPGVSEYHMLYVSEESLSPKTLKKLEELLNMGGLIIGEKPTSAPGLTKKSTVDSVLNLSEKLWTASSHDEHPNTRKVIDKSTPIEELKSLNIGPDFDYSDNHVDQRKAPLDYIHYQKDELDFYFIRNTTNTWISRNCSFRQIGKVPEKWNPETGKVSTIDIYLQKESGTEIPLTLPPYGAFFVVFKDGVMAPKYTGVKSQKNKLPRVWYGSEGTISFDNEPLELELPNGTRQVTDLVETIHIKGSWQLSFPKQSKGPNELELPELMSWTDSKSDAVRYFSGIATYTKTFEFSHADKRKNIYLDLGELAEVADVWLNDTHLGTTWTMPHRFNIGSIIVEGSNRLKIEVANTWSNRLTGDDIKGKGSMETNIVKANKNQIPWKDIPLKKSGLLGPVTIQIHESL